MLIMNLGRNPKKHTNTHISLSLKCSNHTNIYLLHRHHYLASPPEGPWSMSLGFHYLARNIFGSVDSISLCSPRTAWIVELLLKRDLSLGSGSLNGLGWILVLHQQALKDLWIPWSLEVSPGNLTALQKMQAKSILCVWNWTTFVVSLWSCPGNAQVPLLLFFMADLFHSRYEVLCWLENGPVS